MKILLCFCYHFFQVLKVIVPGVNLPLDDIAYLLSAVLLAAIFHELGHAVAAIRLVHFVKN